MASRAFVHHLLAGRLHALPSISHSSLLRCFSTVAKDINPSSTPLSQTLFAVFAAINFNLSEAAIARIFRRSPTLLKLQTLENVKLFVDMLSRVGLTHNQIAQIMMQQSSLLTISAKRLLEPKLQFLKDSGIGVEGLAFMLLRRPRILTASLENHLQPTMAFLRNVFQTQDLLIKALLRNPHILVYNLETTLKPSLAFWEGFGLRGKELSHLLSLKPDILLFSSLEPAKVELIDKIGITADSKMFKYVLRIVVQFRMETLESKMDNFQHCGLTSEETMHLFRISPNVFGFSKEKVWQNMDFIVNTMELPANSVLKDPNLLNCNLDKVLKPRFLVWQKLKSMGGHISIKSFSTVLNMREASFVSKIVKGHPESATLYAIFQDTLADASSAAKKSTKVKYY